MSFRLLYLIFIGVYGWLVLLGRSSASKTWNCWCGHRLRAAFNQLAMAI